MLRPRDGGSVFIEALVALAIVAVVLTTAYRSIGESAIRTYSAERTRGAIVVAESQLARAGVEVPLDAGSVDGDSGTYHWTMTMAADGAPSRNGQLHRVAVTVADRQGGQVRSSLETLRLAPVPR